MDQYEYACVCELRQVNLVMHEQVARHASDLLTDRLKSGQLNCFLISQFMVI